LRPACADGSRPINCATPTVELAREGVAVNIIQRQLGHTDLGTTSAYLQGIDPSEIIDAVRSRRPPTISATAGLAL
jgi:integrase/recombinase XerD